MSVFPHYEKGWEVWCFVEIRRGARAPKGGWQRTRENRIRGPGQCSWGGAPREGGVGRRPPPTPATHGSQPVSAQLLRKPVTSTKPPLFPQVFGVTEPHGTCVLSWGPSYLISSHVASSCRAHWCWPNASLPVTWLVHTGHGLGTLYPLSTANFFLERDWGEINKF